MYGATNARARLGATEVDRLSRWLTVKEAAEAWGISEDAVRKRIKRKTADATQKDGVWRVLVDQGETPRTPQEIEAEEERRRLAEALAEAHREAEEERRRRDTAEARAASAEKAASTQAEHAGELVESLRAQVGQLEEQNRQLWEQFARVNATLDRQASILDRVISLPAKAGPSAGGPDHAEPRRQADDEDARPRSWWQRVFGGRE